MTNGPQIKVMYVEDDADIREIVEMAFELQPDIQFTCCEPSEQVLHIMRTLMPDMVLLDVMMPGIDGMTLARRMRADPQLANIPFAFMTAKAMPQELAQFRELGAIGVISKPFNAFKLVDEVRALASKSSR